MTKFRLLLRRRRVAVVASILIGVLAGVVSSITGSGGRDITTWEAMQVVFVNFDSGQLASAAVINQAAQQATIGDVPTAAKEILKSKLSAKALAKKVSAKAVVESGTIEIKARDTNKKLALRYVQAFGQAFVESSNRELKDAATKKFDATKKRVDEAKAALDEYDAFLSANTGQTPGVEEAIRLRSAVDSRMRGAPRPGNSPPRTLRSRVRIGISRSSRRSRSRLTRSSSVCPTRFRSASRF
ncbi:MAG: hypothetical protein IPG46_08015 [Actinobacteria bacterium]|nr:hypothetical protein [Actinomycetota bacterium]